MSTGLVVYQGRRQAQTGLQRLVECVVLPAVGGFNIREITGLHQVHKCLPAGRLPGLDVDILAKVVFGFTPDIILSPLALPRELVDKKVNSLVANLNNGALQDILLQLKNRPTFAEQWPDEYQAGLVKGKRRILQLEAIRGDSYTLRDIVSEDKEILEWYESIIT